MESDSHVSPITVAIAGATGFIGQHTILALMKEPNVRLIGLTRRKVEQLESSRNNIDWRTVDTYSLPEIDKALLGVDVLLYFIHSMLPSATLLQGEFWQFDAYLADNFARAAVKMELRQIVYLGGIIPETKNLSDHLRSRKEVEYILGSYGTPTTILRAGMIVGKGGSSFRIVEQLVRRLKIMICPSWTETMSQPIDVDDVVAHLRQVLNRPEHFQKTYDIGGDERISYRKMLQAAAEVLGRKVYFLRVPFVSPALSRLWVSTITGVPRNLVYPLVDSLRHAMLVEEKNRLLLPTPPKSFYDSLTDSISVPHKQKFSIGNFIKIGNLFTVHKDVRSIQRFENNQKFRAETVTRLYCDWLPKFLPRIIVNSENLTVVRFRLFSLITLLELTKSERCTPDRSILYITGGILVRKPIYKKGRLEFREILGGKYILSNLQDFRPALPWFIYTWTQAVVHLFVVRKFYKYLDKLSGDTKTFD